MEQPKVLLRKAYFLVRTGENKNKDLSLKAVKKSFWGIADYIVLYKGIAYYVGYKKETQEYSVTISDTGLKLTMDSNLIKISKPQEVAKYIKQSVDDITKKLGEDKVVRTIKTNSFLEPRLITILI